MKRTLAWIITDWLLALALPAFGLETAVISNGPIELAKHKVAIAHDEPVRLIAKGIDPNAYGNLTLSQPGEKISYSAQRDGMPPEVFQRDIPGTDAIFSTTDQMIADHSGPDPTAAAVPKTAEPLIKSIELPFQAHSIAILGEKIFLSDQSTIYELKDRQPIAWWKIPDQEEILRLYAYRDSILVLANNEHHVLYRPDDFVTYRITNGKTVMEWLGAVVPWNGGLISSVIKLAPDITQQANRWSRAVAVEGQPTILPLGLDIIGSIMAEVCPTNKGPEIITFSPSGKLIVTAHKDTLWRSEASFVSLPLFLQQEYIVYTGDWESEEITMTQYYYIPPRIIVKNGMMITIDNNAGRADVLENAKSYSSCRIRGYAWTGQDIEERTIAKSGLGYCTDIALQEDMLMALIVKQSGSLIIFTSW